MSIIERYAKALKEVFEAEKAAVDSGLVGEWEAGIVNSEAYLAQRYVRVQNLVDDKNPKNWDIKTFAEIQYEENNETF
jgi:hypothetical protein